jgi:hypothetical protein
MAREHLVRQILTLGSVILSVLATSMVNPSGIAHPDAFVRGQTCVVFPLLIIVILGLNRCARTERRAGAIEASGVPPEDLHIQSALTRGFLDLPAGQPPAPRTS